MKKQLALTAVCAAILVATPLGCRQSEFERVVVSGTVTCEGRPLVEGSIRFAPAEGQDLPISAAFITDGKYVADKKGGVAVGKYNVEIEGFRPVATPGRQSKPLPLDVDPNAQRYEQFLPEKYNLNTQLELTIQPGSGPVSKDFQLTADSG